MARERRDPSRDLLIGAGAVLAAIAGAALLASMGEKRAAAAPPRPPNPNLPPGAVPLPSPGSPGQTQAQTEAYFGQGGQGPIPAVPPTTAPSPVTRLGNPALLRTGRHYLARIELSPIEAALASPRDVAMRFEVLGFRNVRAYASASELGPVWPVDARAGATSATRWAEGDWGGAESSVPLPPQVAAAWEV